MQSFKDIPIQQTIHIDEGLRLDLSTDHHVLFQLVQNNRQLFLNTMKWVKDFNTLEDSQSFVEAWKKGYEEGNKLCYFIMVGNQVAGFFCYRTLDFATKESEIGYMMDSKYSGKGILRRCIKYMLDYGFDTYSLQRCTLVTTNTNQRSLNVGYKLGFTLHKIESNRMEINGLLQDMVTLELTKQRYQQFKQQEIAQSQE